MPTSGGSSCRTKLMMKSKVLSRCSPSASSWRMEQEVGLTMSKHRLFRRRIKKCHRMRRGQQGMKHQRTLSPSHRLGKPTTIHIHSKPTMGHRASQQHRQVKLDGHKALTRSHGNEELSSQTRRREQQQTTVAATKQEEVNQRPRPSSSLCIPTAVDQIVI